MDIKPVGNNNVQPGQRISETGNFNADLPSVAAKHAPVQTQTVNAVQQAAEVPSMGQLDEAVKKINETLKGLSQNLEFSVDSDSNRTIVRVVDQETRDVIRQIPSPEAVEIAKALDQLQGLLIRQKA